jgi:putative FmdB family regulatory protein
MPFYEYQCQACGHHHEAMQKMGEAPLRGCPACGKPRLKRLISAPVFRLKGKGWYETDFKSDKEAKRNLHAEEAKSDKAGAAGAADQKVEPAKAEPKTEQQTGSKTEAAPAATRSAAKSARKAAPRARKSGKKAPRRR